MVADGLETFSLKICQEVQTAQFFGRNLARAIFVFRRRLSVVSVDNGRFFFLFFFPARCLKMFDHHFTIMVKFGTGPFSRKLKRLQFHFFVLFALNIQYFSKVSGLPGNSQSALEYAQEHRLLVYIYMKSQCNGVWQNIFSPWQRSVEDKLSRLSKINNNKNIYISDHTTEK